MRKARMILYTATMILMRTRGMRCHARTENQFNVNSAEARSTRLSSQNAANRSIRRQLDRLANKIGPVDIVGRKWFETLRKPTRPNSKEKKGPLSVAS